MRWVLCTFFMLALTGCSVSVQRPQSLPASLPQALPRVPEPLIDSVAKPIRVSVLQWPTQQDPRMVIMVDQPLNRLVVTSSSGSATECVGAAFQRCTVDLVNHLRLGSATSEDTVYRLSVWIDEGSAQRELHFFTIAAREFLFPVFRIEIDRAALFASPRAAAITSTVAARGDLMNRADGSADQGGYVPVCIGNGARMWVRRSAGKPERTGWSQTVAVCR